MKRAFFSLLFAFILVFSIVSVVNAGYVKGYYRRDGTYVPGYWRSDPNGLRYDNYSYRYGDPLYNRSYGKYDTYKWNTPSYSWQNDYWRGYNSYWQNNYWDW